MSLRTGETFAGYRIPRLVGSGGMGEVYLVQHPRLPRQEALKVFRPDVSQDDKFRERFIREADLSAAMDCNLSRHPQAREPLTPEAVRPRGREMSPWPI